MMPISRVLLFTLTACPTGKSMGTVLKEVSDVRSDLAIEPVYVELDPGTTNRYRVKTNPTCVFLRHSGEEVFRIEGFKDTADVLDRMNTAESGTPEGKEGAEPARGAALEERYTIHLYRDGKPVPYTAIYANPTAVQAPRITALRLQLESRPDGYDNPFPAGSRLLGVEFQGKQGKITIMITDTAGPWDFCRIVEQNTLLEKTLSLFGIESVIVERTQPTEGGIRHA